jgi:hypothetical protein
MRRFVPIIALALLAGCPSYDPYPYLSSDSGLMDADEWAKYGPDQARAVAIGRAFAQEDAEGAVTYSRKFDTVKSIEVDSLGHRIVVEFSSGWKAQVTPIDDGKNGDETPGI